MLAISTVGEPGIQGAGITGVHGIGVKTPRAAAVADATAGFTIDVHTLNGRMFTKGTLSIMLAIGMLVDTRFLGRTIREEGAAPNEHCSEAPPQMTMPIK